MPPIHTGNYKEKIGKKRGCSGFGYDPVFVPEGYTETFAEMGNEEKNKIRYGHKSKEYKTGTAG